MISLIMACGEQRTSSTSSRSASIFDRSRMSFSRVRRCRPLVKMISR